MRFRITGEIGSIANPMKSAEPLCSESSAGSFQCDWWCMKHRSSRMPRAQHVCIRLESRRDLPGHIGGLRLTVTLPSRCIADRRFPPRTSGHCQLLRNPLLRQPGLRLLKNNEPPLRHSRGGHAQRYGHGTMFPGPATFDIDLAVSGEIRIREGWYAVAPRPSTAQQLPSRSCGRGPEMPAAQACGTVAGYADLRTGGWESAGSANPAGWRSSIRSSQLGHAALRMEGASFRGERNTGCKAAGCREKLLHVSV